MAVLYISEAEAVRDFASVLAQVRAGTQVVIENEECNIALVKPAIEEAEEPEPGYDEWFRAEVQQVLDKGPHETISHENAQFMFAEKREATLRRIQDMAE